PFRPRRVAGLWHAALDQRQIVTRGFGDMSNPQGTHPGPLPGMGSGPTAPASAPGRGMSGQPGTGQPATTAGSSSYSVDVERAPQAIADLRRAAQALKDEADNALNLANITPPGLDVVSANATQVFIDAAVGSQRSVRLALLRAAARFEQDAAK